MVSASIRLAIESSIVQNSVFLVKDQEGRQIHEEPRASVLVSVLRRVHALSRGRFRGMVVLLTPRDTPEVVQLLTDALPASVSITDLGEHVQTMELRDLLREKWGALEEQVLVTCSNALLHLFCLGFIQIKQLDFIFFDNLTVANNNHPYCMIMEVSMGGAAVFLVFLLGCSGQAVCWRDSPGKCPQDIRDR